MGVYLKIGRIEMELFFKSHWREFPAIVFFFFFLWKRHIIVLKLINIINFFQLYQKASVTFTVEKIILDW